MAEFRKKILFDKTADNPFKLSRSKLELFTKCPRCFYLDRKLGIAQPSGPPFNLNTAVDHLLKKEFDVHRAKKTKHPLMKAYRINAIPFDHPELDTWRKNFFGIQYHHAVTNMLITGAIDDIWVNPRGELHVVDYKATSKDSEITIDAAWQDSYKRQMEIYQWLLRNNGFTVSDTGYFVYCNGKKDRAAFDGRLEFDLTIIPYTGDDHWVENSIIQAHKCLTSEKMPTSSPACEFCSYRKAASRVESD